VGWGGGVFDAGRELVAREGVVGHECVQVGVGERPVPVGAGDGGDGLVAVVDGGAEGGGLFGEADSDECDFEFVLVGDVFVERWGANLESVGDGAHRDAVGTMRLQQVPSDVDDLIPPAHVRVRLPSGLRSP
jgi:hypothetical protein